MYVILMVYGAAMLPLNYVGSFFFKGPGVGFGFIFFANILLGEFWFDLFSYLLGSSIH